MNDQNIAFNSANSWKPLCMLNIHKTDSHVGRPGNVFHRTKLKSTSLSSQGNHSTFISVVKVLADSPISRLSLVKHWVQWSIIINQLWWLLQPINLCSSVVRSDSTRKHSSYLRVVGPAKLFMSVILTRRSVKKLPWIWFRWLMKILSDIITHTGDSFYYLRDLWWSLAGQVNID